MPANPAEGALRSIDLSPGKGGDVPTGRGGSSRWKGLGRFTAILMVSAALTMACDPKIQLSPGAGDALRNVAPNSGQHVR